MKKLILLFTITLIAITSGKSQNVNIPDENFKAYLLGNSNINTNGDTEIQLSEANFYDGIINCSDRNITDITGIEDFIALTDLRCSNNMLTKINISKNTSLNTLFIFNNQLTEIDVSKNTKLTGLIVSNNQLTNLDVTKNVNLIFLGTGKNELTDLNLSTNIALESLGCQNNQLISLDLRNNTFLIDLFCENNQLTSLDISNGNNNNIPPLGFSAENNPNLSCISVDDEFTPPSTWTKDENARYSNIGCSLEISPLTLESKTINCTDTDFDQSISTTAIFPENVYGMNFEILYDANILTPEILGTGAGATSHGKYTVDYEGSTGNVSNEITDFTLLNDLRVSQTDNTINSTSGGGWGTSGAILDGITLSEGDFLTYSTNPNGRQFLGLSRVDVDKHFNTIEYGILSDFTSTIRIYESGAHRQANAVSVTESSVIKILIEDGKVKYFVDDVILTYESTLPDPSAEYLVDMAFAFRNEMGFIKDLTITKSGEEIAGSKMKVSMYLENAPTGTTFVSGEDLLDIKWTFSPDASLDTPYEISMDNIQVSYAVGFESLDSPEAVTFTKDGSSLAGKLKVVTPNNQLIINDRSVLTIDGIDDNCDELPDSQGLLGSTLPNTEGESAISLEGISKLRINKDISGDQNTTSENCTVVNNEINSADLEVAIQILNGEIEASPYQLLATDVNLDGAITESDLTLISSRAINENACEFPQLLNYNADATPKEDYSPSRDWLFIDEETAGTFNFTSSNIPSLETCLPLPQACSNTKNYVGILLGDVNQNWNETTSLLRKGDLGGLLLDYSNTKELENGHLLVPVVLTSADFTYGIDMTILNPELNVLSIVQAENVSTNWNDLGNKILLQTFNRDGLANSEIMFYLEVASETEIEENITLYLNGAKRKVVNGLNSKTEYLGNLEVFPNPAKNVLQINTQELLSGTFALEVYDLTGRLVKSNSTTLLNTNLSSLNIESLTKGNYLLKITTDNGTTSVPFVKE